MKIKYIVLFGLILLLFNTACDEYLDVIPDSRTELDTDEKITSMLVRAYPSRTFAYMTEMESDNTDWKDAGSYTAYNKTQEQMFFWQDVKDEAGYDSPENFWGMSYRAIASANLVLQKIEELGNPERLNPQRGEALVTRAYNHFYLVNIFSKHYSESTGETDLGVPYVEELETTVNPTYERGSVAEVYRKIERDLLEGLKLIDDNAYEVPKYHFNRKAAYAFAARYYLFVRQYDKVIEYANRVLGDNPQEMLRNMQQFTTLTSNFLLRAQHYVKMEHNTNLLVAQFYSYLYVLGNYNTGKKYPLSKLISGTEALESPGPWGNYTSSIYYQAPYSYVSGASGYVATPKIPYYFEYTNPVARIGQAHAVQVLFSADELLLCRAEAYIMKEDYGRALNDLNLWITQRMTTGVVLGRGMVNDYYSNLEYYLPETPTAKKALHPEFTIVSDEQENFLHCLLHIRRIETMHDGLRWFDVKRFGIEIYRRRLDANDNVTVLDELKVNDPRRAIQLPYMVITAGLQANPR